MTSLQLHASPRLYTAEVVGELATGGLDSIRTTPYLTSVADGVLRDADRLARMDPLEEGVNASYLEAGRNVQSRLECLACAWALTRKAKYREAGIRHLGGLRSWNHISCEAKGTPPEVELPFCLTYGEQSQAIGVMYDLFRPDMTEGEQQVFNDVIDRFHLKEAVKCLTSPPWWANKAWSNWNGVCCGGMGILALAFYDDRPETHDLIPFVEASLAEYFSSYVDNGGGCHEGTGYWNYGMNYAMRYVLSWESATGKVHPALKIKELGKSLSFPVDFTGISFGDNDGWGPTAFYFLLARRLKQPNLALRAAKYLYGEAVPGKVPTKRKTRDTRVANGDILYAANAIPSPEQLAELKAKHEAEKVPVARIYKGMDWAALADDEAFPSLRMAIRGGSAKVQGHGMTDLLSFRCRVNGELMITDQAEAGYLSVTFGRRGGDLYTRTPESKSTLFVEGLGCAKDAECDKTELVKGEGLSGVRIEATRIYMPRLAAKFIGRLFLLVDNAYWLVVDHVVTNRSITKFAVESRFHTLADYTRGKQHVGLASGGERMQMTFASLTPSVLQESRGMPASPKAPQTTIFRWLAEESVHDCLHVVALNPGSKRAKLDLAKDGSTYVIGVDRPGAAPREIRLSSQLKLRR